MARGDASFARCNVDWIDDPRCEALPSNDARWLNHVCWLICVKVRSHVVPRRYSPLWFSRKFGISESSVQECVRAMVDHPLTEDRLASITPAGDLVIEGVKNQNSKLSIEPPPEVRDNPWLTDTGYIWGLYGSKTSERERERERDIGKGDGTEHPLRGSSDRHSDPLFDPTTGKPMEFPLKALRAVCIIPRKKALEWFQTYGESFDVMGEIRKCRQWLRDNPARCKTDRGNTIRFVGNWLRKTQNDGSGQPALGKAEIRRQFERLAAAKKADAEQARRHSRTPGAECEPASVGDVLKTENE